jgi:Tol biopolymer transport system component
VRIAAVCLSALVLASTAGAGPGNGPILVLAQPAGQGSAIAPELFSIRADGSQPTRLTTFHPVQPVMSPDGTKVAFFLTDGGSPRDLYVMNADGTNARQLRSYPEYENSGGLRDVTWSPDGSRLAYLLPQFVNGEQLRIVEIDSGADVPVVPDVMGKSQLAWAPDGTEIAFSGFGQNGVPGIHVKNVATGAVRTVVSTSGAVYPKWSPDGRLLAYVLQPGGVWVVPREGGPPRQVGQAVVVPAYTSGPLWSPDGRSVYFTQAVSVGAPYFRGIPTVHFAAFAAGVDASGQRQVRAGVTPLAWSPEGDALVVGGRSGVFFTRPDGKCLTFVSEGTFVGWRPGGNPPPPFECVDLVAQVDAPSPVGRVGASFAIAVVNEGTRPDSARLRQQFDDTVTPLAYDKRVCGFATPVLTCELGTLAPGERREVRVTVRAPRGLLGSRVEVVGSARDSDPTSNTVTTYVRVHRCWLLGREVQADVLRGTSRDELICGLSGDDALYGAGGNDTLDGGYGADALYPGAGKDAVAGGYGDDRVFARDGARDKIDCGRGIDTVAADRTDAVARSCERVARR